MRVTQFSQVALLGCGLIGGSLALALKQAGCAKYIVGYDLNPEALDIAMQSGVIDQKADNLVAAVERADLIILATPVGGFVAIAKVLQQINYDANKLPLITDVGSSKMQVVQLLRQHMPKLMGKFVPAHPIAGRELAGIKYAIADLFKDVKVVLTPSSQTQSEAVQQVTALWQAVGSKVEQLSPSVHDEIYAAVSHLPHLIAFAYMQGLLENAQNNEDILNNRLAFAGTGFRDFSRIAGGDATLWRDVFLTNKQQLLQQCDAFKLALAEIEQYIIEEDAQHLSDVLQRLGEIRRKFNQ